MKNNGSKTDFILSVQRITLVVFAIGAFSFVCVGLLDKYLSLKDATEAIRSDYLESQKLIVKTQVEGALMVIEMAADLGVGQDEIIRTLSKIRFGDKDDGYIFLNTYDGIPLLFDAGIIKNGKSIWDLTDPNGIKVIQKERDAVRNPAGDFISYSWRKLSNNTVTPKISFVKGFPRWEWMVGAGVYLDTLESNISDLQRLVVKDTIVVAVILTAVLLFLLFLMQYIFKGLTKSIAAEIKLFSTYFDTAAEDSVEIDISGIKYNIFSHIAEDINRMVRNKREADRKIFESQQRLKLQREQLPLGYVEWDLDYRIIDWNPSAERIFGYTREEVIGKGFQFLISDELVDDISSVFESLIYETGGRRNINVNITKDGRKISCEWLNKVFTDKDGNILSIVSIVDDISERKKMEDKLQESLDQKRILLKEVHHRVKNNMAIISSFISLQSMSVEDENVRSLLRNSENRVKSMALIHEHLYKSENLQDINVQKYVEELVMTLLDSYGYGADGIKTSIEILEFNLDLDRLIPLGMLINEILSNSLKHAFGNTSDPEIFLSLFKDGEDGYILRIGDNGSGLPGDDSLKKCDSIGFMLIEGLVQQIDGEMEILRENGTEYIITIQK